MLDMAFNWRALGLALGSAALMSGSALAQQSARGAWAPGHAAAARIASNPAGAAATAAAPAAGLNLIDLANGYAGSVPALPAADGPLLMVFVSFSMPQPSLARLVEQAESSGAVLVLRGLDQGSMLATAKRIKALIGQRRVQFQIDPQSFERYGVRAVPTFVLTSSSTLATPCSGAQCFANAQFASVSGDVSIAYALEQIERGAPRFAGQARTMQRKTGGG